MSATSGGGNNHFLNMPQSAVMMSRSELNLMLCGVGTGKSHVAGYLAYRFARMFPKVKGFIGANYYQQLDKATLERCKEVWGSFGLKEYTRESGSGDYVSGVRPPNSWLKNFDHKIDDYRGTIVFRNGALIFTGSMDNAKAHDGKQFGWLILDETKDTRETDVKDVMIPRVRQVGLYQKPNGQLTTSKAEGKEFNPTYFLTTPAKVEWLNEMFNLEAHIAEIETGIYNKETIFRLNEGNKFVTIASTYHNQENLPRSYIQNIIDSNSAERVKALVWGNPFSTSGGEFYSSFSRMNHVKEKEYNPAIPIHVSFDQNTVPYNSALIAQLELIDGVWHNHCIDEVTLGNPNNSTEEVCEEVLRRYGDANGVFIYGDASGRARSTVSKNERHHYEVISRMFAHKLSNTSNRVLKRNPPLIARREFVNKIFENKLPIRLCVSNKCGKLLADLTYLKQDIDGGKKKELETNKDTGERYQKYGHLSDCLDYFLTSAYAQYFTP